MVNDRLLDAVEWSRERLSHFRSVRNTLLRQYVGSHYSPSGVDVPVPINVLALQADIYAASMINSRPQALVISRDTTNRRQSQNFELAINKTLDAITIEETLQHCALDAMFGLTAVKIGTYIAREVDFGDGPVGVPEVFVDPISLDDWVHDMAASSWSTISFMGHRYRLPTAEARKRYGKDIAPMGSITQNNDGDERDISLMLDEDYQDKDRMEDVSELYDLYLPRTNELVTMDSTDNGGPGRVLARIPWEGPAGGPFRPLKLRVIPGTTMPGSILATTVDLHDMLNDMMRKLAAQQARQKNLLAGTMGDETDVNAINQARDGEAIGISNPDSFKPLAIGGIDQPSFALFLQLRQLHSMLSGNLDSMGGLSAQADTLGQERILAASAGSQLRQAQITMARFVRQVIRDVAWHIWENPATYIPIEKKVGSLTIQDAFSGMDKTGSFDDYTVDIQPFSLQDNPPAARLAMLERYMGGIAGPLMPMMQAQGIAIDIRELNDMFAKYANMPELNSITVDVEPGAGESHEAGMGTKSGTTTRRYERINRPSGNEQSRTNAMTAALLGANEQPAERAQAGV